MISTLGKGEVVEVDIDLLKEYYEKTNNFVKLVRITLYGEQEEI